MGAKRERKVFQELGNNPLHLMLLREKSDEERNNIGFSNMRWLITLTRAVLAEQWE